MALTVCGGCDELVDPMRHLKCPGRKKATAPPPQTHPVVKPQRAPAKSDTKAKVARNGKRATPPKVSKSTVVPTVTAGTSGTNPSTESIEAMADTLKRQRALAAARAKAYRDRKAEREKGKQP